jgi:hypothetical protein
MPNKHKNREKQSENGGHLPTPPATPTLSTNVELLQRLDLSRDHTINMPSPPPTPDRDGVPSSTTASSLAEVSTLSPDAVTIKVVARPTDTFPAPTLNVHDGSECTSPIEYFRWPAPECDIRDEIQPPSNRSWRIGKKTLSSVVSGESSASPAELAGPLAFMLAWLFTMEECALDIGYDAAEWAELCRRTWTVFTKAELHSSLDLRKEVFMLTIEREFARWGRLMPVAQLAAAESRALPSHIIQCIR